MGGEDTPGHRGRASPFGHAGYVIRPMAAWTAGDPPAATSVGATRRSLPGAPSGVATDDGHIRPALTRHHATRSITEMFATRTRFRASDVVIRAAIVGLALSTAYIHSTLGGLLFTLNAIGYVTAAIAIVVPLALAVRFRWFVRLGLAAYAMTTIIGWAIQGPYYSTAFIAKGIEVALIAVVAIDFVRMDGNPVNVVKREVAALGDLIGGLRGSAGAGA
jgi:hypothetical protein